MENAGVCSSYVSPVSLDSVVIVLPVCSQAHWTQTTIGSCKSLWRFDRVTVWSNLGQHVFLLCWDHRLDPSPHLTTNTTNHVTAMRQSLSCEIVQIPHIELLYLHLFLLHFPNSWSLNYCRTAALLNYTDACFVGCKVTRVTIYHHH